MSYSQDRTSQLWRTFMPRRKEITNRLNSNFYSLQVYDSLFDFKTYSPNTSFVKWALVETADVNAIPDGMVSFLLPSGLYAVFLHQGPASAYYNTFNFIYQTWLPSSAYIIDHRPHFEILPENYRHDDPEAEEEIWVPVQQK